MKTKIVKNKTVPMMTFYIDAAIANYLNRRSRKLNSLRGQRMAIFANDWIGIQLNLHGIYEKEELDLLFEFLSPLDGSFSNGLALDIGANIGNHTVFFSKKFKKIYSFEPNPTTYELLRFNSISLSNAKALNYGLGDVDGEVELYEDPENMGGSSIRLLDKKNYEAKKVNIKKLDCCDLDLDGLCFLKIDVEGCEAEVLRGGFETLKKYQPVIILEQLKSEFRCGTTKAIKILQELGYSFCWIEIEKNKMPWIFRRLVNIYELIVGKTIRQRIVKSDTVPASTYSMLIAIPHRHRELLEACLPI
jgi:FkbM family methyltransferase